MRRGGVYEVSKRRGYRGHPPGTIFAAVLDPNAEQRAILRGDIRLIEAVTPSLQPGSFTLPTGWLTEKEEVQ